MMLLLYVSEVFPIPLATTGGSWPTANMDGFQGKAVFAQRNIQTGLIEIIDMHTGLVLSTEEAPGMREARKEYNEIIADLICNAIAEGSSLTRVCKLKGFPSYVQVCHWRRMHPAFEEALSKARADRAETLRDDAMEIVDTVNEDQDAIAKAKLRADTRKWSAGVDNNAYSPKAKVEASLNVPMQILISTGIKRDVTPPAVLGEIPELPVGHILEEKKDGGNESKINTDSED